MSPLERGYATIQNDLWRIELKRIEQVFKIEIETLQRRVRKLEARVKTLEDGKHND